MVHTAVDHSTLMPARGGRRRKALGWDAEAKHSLTGLVHDKGSSLLASLSFREAAKGLNLIC